MAARNAFFGPLASVSRTLGCELRYRILQYWSWSVTRDGAMMLWCSHHNQGSHCRLEMRDSLPGRSCSCL